MFGPSFSIGEESEMEVREEESLMLELTAMELTLSMLGYCDNSLSVSSRGRQVSTSASRQFTNSSTFSALLFDLVKKPANRQSPPKPQLWETKSSPFNRYYLACSSPAGNAAAADLCPHN